MSSRFTRSLLVLGLALPALAAATSPAPPSSRANDPLARRAVSGNPAERAFAALAADYLRGFFAFEPSFATTSGLHRYDSLLEDRSRAAIDGETARTRRVLAGLKRIDAGGLSDSTRIDYDLFARGVEGHLFDLTEIRRWENDPSTYNYGHTIFALIARNYAPPEQRLRMVTARLRQVPRLLASGKENVKNPPEMFARFGAEDLGGTIEF